MRIVVSSGDRVTAKFQTCKCAHRLDVVECRFGARIGQLVPLLEKVDPQHHVERIRLPPLAGLGIVRLDQIKQRHPRHNGVHLAQEPLTLGLELGRDAIPDETTILNFRHLLETHHLTKAIFEAVSAHLEDKGALLRGGTIMDATLIAASPSTKNKEGRRDPEMSQSKKSNQWYFGMKTHIGVDARSGLVHTAGVTTGKVHDAKVMDNLIREDDRAVFADKGYVNEKKKRVARRAGVYWAVKEKPKAGRRLSPSQIKRNRRHGAIRAKVEHVFRVLKCQFGYRKVRYRGIEKNGAQVFTLLALANLFLARRQLRCA